MDSFRTPTGTREKFLQIVNAAAETFPENKFCRQLASKEVNVGHYHGLLRMIFYQTYYGPTFLALASAHCEEFRPELREYLIHHAEEEKTHYTWILNDLKNTGYTGPDPRSEFPPEACQAYVSFNYYVATKKPIARLAIAMMLENLGATVGKKYAIDLCKALSLKEDQASFFFGHSDTDIGHTRDVLNVIDGCNLTPEEWGWMCFAAETAAKMYRRMYDEVIP